MLTRRSHPEESGPHAHTAVTLVSEYTLPELPYDYAALEPHISGKIMELHHDKHHAAYVAGANAALDKLAELRAADAIAPVVNLHEKNLAFHLGGHTNHTVFWNNLSPDGGDKPEGELAAAIEDQFGGFDAFPPTSTPTPTPSRAPAGPSSPGTPSASD